MGSNQILCAVLCIACVVSLQILTTNVAFRYYGSFQPYFGCFLRFLVVCPSPLFFSFVTDVIMKFFDSTYPRLPCRKPCPPLKSPLAILPGTVIWPKRMALPHMWSCAQFAPGRQPLLISVPNESHLLREPGLEKKGVGQQRGVPLIVPSLFSGEMRVCWENLSCAVVASSRPTHW